MKKLLILTLTLIGLSSCQKQNCDDRVSSCTYVLWSYSDCTPNHWEVRELDNGWSQVRSDTFTYPVWGCPSQIEKQFYDNQAQVQRDINTLEDVRQFISHYPNTCNCNE